LRYDSLSEDLGGFVEVIRPGACRDVMRDDVRCLVDHNPSLLLGRTASGTLQLRDDGRGLLFDLKLGAQSYAQDVAISMERGDLNQCSFSFDVGLDRWAFQPNGTLLREILQLKRLYDVALVTFPAYPAADAVLRDSKARAAPSEAWRIQHMRRRLELIAIETPTTRNHRSTGETNMATEFRRERAVDDGRQGGKRSAVLELMEARPCACGAAAKEVTIDTRGGSMTITPRCPAHRDSRPTTMGERRLQLDLLERELRDGAVR
jgi:hypothetical protein